MAESVELWWARRQWSKGREVPYRVGRFRSDWERYPVLIRQYHPDLNYGITLTQIPPAAEVYLVWECDAGHRFVATPQEQRDRPTGSRRRSTWCPECALGAINRPTPTARAEPVKRTPRNGFPCGHPRGSARRDRTRDYCLTCRHASAGADRQQIGAAFTSPWAPKPASAAEDRLRMLLRERLDVDFGFTAVRVATPFFHHIEVWPDFVLSELRIAIEYDTTGRDGLEHVGPREAIDRRKDRLLRAVGWEVIRIRCGKLLPIGPVDIVAAGVSNQLVDRIIDRIAEVRGALIVEAFRREPRIDDGGLNLDTTSGKLGGKPHIDATPIREAHS